MFFTLIIFGNLGRIVALKKGARKKKKTFFFALHNYEETWETSSKSLSGLSSCLPFCTVDWRLLPGKKNLKIGQIKENEQLSLIQLWSKKLEKKSSPLLTHCALL